MVNRQRNQVAELFGEIQGSRPSRKNVVLLRQHLIESNLEDFSAQFFDCLNRALVCKKSDGNADRVLKFVAHFVSMLESADEEEAESFGELATALIEHLLRGIESKDKHVRYRVCQLFAFIMTSGLSEIDEELFEFLQNALTKRLRDRESNVRVQAVIALSRFQAPAEEEDEEVDPDEAATKVTEVLLHVLSHDPSAEVRRTVLHNLTQSTATLPFLLERARDLDPIIRRQIYSTTLPSINGFKPLSISKRNKLLKWGLKDRDENVRRAAEKMFAVDWLNLANGSILELLQRLDIVNSTIGEDVMRAFFQCRPEFITQISLDDTFWSELNPESIFLVRCMNDYAQKGEIAQVVADKLPELSTISDLIVRHIVEANAQQEPEKADTEFIIENLLRLALKLDFSDEIGRKRLTSNCHEIMRSGLNENLLTLSVEVLSKVTLSELELAKTVREIITDIYDALQDEDEADESFHSADSNMTPRARSVTPVASKGDDEERQVKYIFTTLRVLAIIGSLLKQTTQTLRQNPSLLEILQAIIVPAYRSHEGPICEKGIECLGQICLQDKELATQYLGHFFNCFAKGYEDLKILALKCVTDILIAHPTLLTDASSTDGTEVTKELGGEETKLEDDLVRIYLKAFQLDDLPEVTAMATQSVSKLLLFNVLSSESENARGLLKEMTVLYYSPDSADNQSLRQNLAYFFPVYCYSSIEHQTAMTAIVVSTLKRIARLYDQLDVDSKADAVTLLSIGNQLMDWTNPQKLVHGDTLAGQMQLIAPMQQRLQSADKEETRALCAALSKMYIDVDAQVDVEEVMQQAEDMVEGCSDAISRRLLLKFKTNLEKLKERNMSEASVPTDSAAAVAAADEEEEEEEGSDAGETVGDQTLASVAESEATVT